MDYQTKRKICLYKKDALQALNMEVAIQRTTGIIWNFFLSLQIWHAIQMTTCLNEDRVYMLSKVGVGGSLVYSQLMMMRPPSGREMFVQLSHWRSSSLCLYGELNAEMQKAMIYLGEVKTLQSNDWNFSTILGKVEDRLSRKFWYNEKKTHF